jgi:hypothetical protein
VQSQTVTPADELVSKKTVAEEFDSCTKTIDRWEDDPKLRFPKSLLINRRRFWRRSELEAFKRAQVHAALASRDPARAASSHLEAV